MPPGVIDLNSDLGEGCGTDADLLPFVTSANVACGFHAGGPAVAADTLRQAARHGTRVGAHPGFADREHLGRRELAVGEQQLFDETVYQLGALAGLARAAGLTVEYVKPHGALYHLAGRDDAYARPLVAAAELFGLAVVGLPGSRLQAECAGRCRFVAEGFADRRYRPDGSLVPRGEPDALIHDPVEAAAQAEALARDHGVETICVHGDTPGAVAFAAALRQALADRGWGVRSFLGAAAT